jgi:DNA-binding protein H-NS
MDTNVADGTDQAIPLFYMEPVELIAKSKEEGRPVFRDTEFVKIMLPGFKDIVCRKVRPEDIDRWPQHYRKFKENNNTETIVGTPISQWNGIKPSQAAACKSLNILSVEALANLPDQPLRKLGPDCYELQKRAKDFLNAANSNSRISELESKLADALKQIEELKNPAPAPIPVIDKNVNEAVKSAFEIGASPATPKKYVHPDGRTWSGKGRKPQWVKDMEAK